MSTFINDLTHAIHDTQRFRQMIATIRDYNFTLFDLTAIKLKLKITLMSSSVTRSLIIEFCHALNQRFLLLEDEHATTITDVTKTLQHIISEFEAHLVTNDNRAHTPTSEGKDSPGESDSDSSSATIGVKRKVSSLNFTSIKRQRLNQDSSQDDKKVTIRESVTLANKLIKKQEQQKILEFFEEEQFNLKELEALVEKNSAIWMPLAFIKENFSLFVFDFKFTKEQLLSMIVKPGATARFEALRDYYFTFNILGATNSETIQIGRYCPENTLRFLGENFWQFVTQGFRPEDIITELHKTDILTRLEIMLHKNVHNTFTSDPDFLNTLQLEAYELEQDNFDLILSLPVDALAADFYKINHYLGYLSAQLKESYQICTDHFTFKIPQSYLEYLKPYLKNAVKKINLTDLNNILPDARRYHRTESIPRGLKIMCDNQAQAYFTAKRINLIKMAVQCTFVIKFKKNPLPNFTITLDNNSVLIDDGDALLTILEQRDSLQKIIDNLESHLYGHLRTKILSRPKLEKAHPDPTYNRDGYAQNNFFFDTSLGKDEAEEYSHRASEPCL